MDDQKDLKDEQKQVSEGEIVDDSALAVSDSSATANATILESLEGMIRDNLVRIDKLKEEAKQHKEMIDSALANDEVYKQHDEAAKAAAKTKNNTKAQILKRPENASIAQKLKDVKTEIAEIVESMNSYLQEYRRLSGSDEIEAADGSPMQIVYKAVLVRRKP